MKSKNFIIPLIIYPFDVMVSYNQSAKQLAKSLRQNSVNDDVNSLRGDGITSARTTMLSGGQTIIVMNPKQFSQCSLEQIIAHEVFHAVTFIMDRVGMKFKLMVSDEAYAYLIGYLVGEIHKQLETINK